MMRERIKAALSERAQTLDELSRALGIPRAQLRTALVPELYMQSEIDHPEHGPMTVWSVRGMGTVRVDGKGRYYCPAAEQVVA